MSQNRKHDLRESYLAFNSINEANGLSPQTTDFYQKKLSQFFDFCEEKGVRFTEDVTRDLIRSYFKSLWNRDLKRRSVHAHARCIRAFFNALVRDELLDKSPLNKGTMPSSDRQVLKPLTDEEVERVKAACKTPRERAIITTLLESGIRAGELVNLRIKHVNLETGAIYVVKGKGGKSRTTFVGPEGIKRLRFYLYHREIESEDDPIFLNEGKQKRNALGQSGLGKFIGQLSERARVEFSPHTLRRTFAVRCLRNGMNLYNLAELMGHGDIDVLRSYLSLSPEDSIEAYKKHGPKKK